MFVKQYDIFGTLWYTFVFLLKPLFISFSSFGSNYKICGLLNGSFLVCSFGPASPTLLGARHICMRYMAQNGAFMAHICTFLHPTCKGVIMEVRSLAIFSKHKKQCSVVAVPSIISCSVLQSKRTHCKDHQFQHLVKKNQNIHKTVEWEKPNYFIICYKCNIPCQTI